MTTHTASEAHIAIDCFKIAAKPVNERVEISNRHHVVRRDINVSEPDRRRVVTVRKKEAKPYDH